MNHKGEHYWKFCNDYSLEYVRDYVNYFFDWFAKRTLYYISDEKLININARLQNKYGPDLARSWASKPRNINKRFGLIASADFCRISPYSLLPMNGLCCYICKKTVVSEITEVNPDDEIWLTEYNTKGIFIGTLYYGIPLIALTHDIETLCAMDQCRKPTLKAGLCSELECLELDAWRKNRSKSLVRRNIPSLKIIDKQHTKYKKPFIALRYLDYKARLQEYLDADNGN